MINTQEKKIGANTYVVTQFGAKVGRRVMFRLVKMLGPMLGGFVKGGFSGAAVGSALQSFSEAAGEDDFDWLCDAFAEVTTVKKPLKATNAKELPIELEKVFDDHFRGHYGDMILWLAFAVEVNFSSFFSEIGSGDPRLAALLAADPPPKDPPASE